MMSEDCRRLLSHLSEYLDGETEASVKDRIEHHLQHCRECKEKALSLRQCLDLLVAAPEEHPSSEARRKTVEALKALRHKTD